MTDRAEKGKGADAASPRPWLLLTGGSVDGREAHIITTTAGPDWASSEHWIGEFIGPLERAQTVVRAVNVLREIIKEHDSLSEFSMRRLRIDDLITEARAALAAADRGVKA